MGSGVLAAVEHKADRTAQWAAVALGFSIPISTALDSVLLVVVVAGWLLAGAWRAKWDAVRGNRVVLAALALFGLLLLGTLYGERNPGDAAVMLRKYLDLLWIPVLIWVMRDPAMRARALLALAASLALVILISFLIMADVIPETRILSEYLTYPVVFKGRQTHGPLVAFGAFLYMQFALAAARAPMRVLWLVLAVLALINGTLVVQGATGYLVFAILTLYLGYTWTGWRGVTVATAAGAAVVVALALTPGPFQTRVTQVRSEIAKWRPGVLELESSAGTRLELYRVSLAAIRDRPLLGHGTGSYTRAFSTRAPGVTSQPMRNPHSEYLHLMVQLGLVGLAGLLYLFMTHWRLAPALASPLEFRLARALILMMAVGCLFNSWLMDHTEGLLYAWLTGLLFAGLKPRGTPEMGNRK
jgi:O-antigen ligase